MRKLSLKNILILMAIAMIVVPSVGCGRCRGLFRRGAPCGTTMAPAALGAPVAMSAPVAAAVPVGSDYCCPPCPPCGMCDPCTSGCGECCGPTAGYETGYMAQPNVTVAPQSNGSDYRDPGPTGGN
jgi:hypothetical protein